MKRSALFLLIDALRRDVLFASDQGIQFLTPNLNRLLRKGFVSPVVTNAQSTQFVLPALFTQTYPLDYGGYNDGIVHRPRSMVECLKENGYDTHLAATANQLGLSLGYDRGFNHIGTTSDYRTLIEHRITRHLTFTLQTWRKGELTKDDVVTIIKNDFLRLVDSVIKNFLDHDKRFWPKQLMTHNKRIYEGCLKERIILETNPEVVLDKLLKIPAGVYWKFLGVTIPQPSSLFVARAFESISWRSRDIIKKITWFPFLPLSHYQALAGEVFPLISEVFTQTPTKPKLLYMHIMDVHDCRAINRPLHVLGRLRFLPRWLVARLRGYTKRRFLYDSALMYVDKCLGKVLDELERAKLLDEIVILVTGDHASQYAESPRKKFAVGFRTFYEDIDVPVLVCGANKAPSGAGLTDSMGVSASFLEALNVPPHESFKGLSVFGPGREAIISENCGSGSGDVERRDLFFTITTSNAKLMAVLRGRNMEVSALFDKISDPRELINTVENTESIEKINDLLDHLWRERKEILTMRGWSLEQGFTIRKIPT